VIAPARSEARLIARRTFRRATGFPEAVEKIRAPGLTRIEAERGLAGAVHAQFPRERRQEAHAPVTPLGLGAGNRESPRVRWRVCGAHRIHGCVEAAVGASSRMAARLVRQLGARRDLVDPGEARGCLEDLLVVIRARGSVRLHEVEQAA
jgi:hypothetical protein